jgi:hypothetical protein
MIKISRLDSLFGPVGKSAGFFIFVAGIIVTFHSFLGIILVLTGAFVGFSYTGTKIDFQKKRIRFSNYLFGIIPIGQWITIEPTMKIGIKKSNKLWRAYSRGNRVLDINNTDYRLVLLDSHQKEIVNILKANDIITARQKIEILNSRLGLGPD